MMRTNMVSGTAGATCGDRFCLEPWFCSHTVRVEQCPPKVHVLPRTSACHLTQKQGLCRRSQLRRDGLRVGPESSLTGILVRREETQTGTG